MRVIMIEMYDIFIKNADVVIENSIEKLNVGMQEIGIKRDKKLIDKLLIYIQMSILPEFLAKKGLN